MIISALCVARELDEMMIIPARELLKLDEMMIISALCRS